MRGEPATPLVAHSQLTPDDASSSASRLSMIHIKRRATADGRAHLLAPAHVSSATPLLLAAGARRARSRRSHFGIVAASLIFAQRPHEDCDFSAMARAPRRSPMGDIACACCSNTHEAGCCFRCAACQLGAPLGACGARFQAAHARRGRRHAAADASATLGRARHFVDKRRGAPSSFAGRHLHEGRCARACFAASHAETLQRRRLPGCFIFAFAAATPAQQLSSRRHLARLARSASGPQIAPAVSFSKIARATRAIFALFFYLHDDALPLRHWPLDSATAEFADGARPGGSGGPHGRRGARHGEPPIPALQALRRAPQAAARKEWRLSFSTPYFRACHADAGRPPARNADDVSFTRALNATSIFPQDDFRNQRAPIPIPAALGGRSTPSPRERRV